MPFLEQRQFEFQKRSQEFIRVDNVALSVFVRSDNPAPALRRSAALFPRPTGSVELVGDHFAIFHGIPLQFHHRMNLRV
jgi:hypothetical protein